MYWETRTGILRSAQTTVRVPGRSVVSVRNGWPSTWPRRTAERRRLIGKSGLVTSVGFENAGSVRSTRLLSGAQPRPVKVPHGTGGSRDGAGAGAVDGRLEPPHPAR